MHVHTALGPGLLESLYERCLCIEFSKRNLSFERQRAVPVIYEGISIPEIYRIDLLVERRVVVEVKSVEHILPIHLAQVLTYLKLTNLTVAMLFNFNSVHLKSGMHRVLNQPRFVIKESSS